MLKRDQLFVVARLTPQLIERAVACRRHQPRAGPLWSALDRPAFERHEQGILNHLFGDFKVAQDAHERSYQLARLLAEHRAERRMCLVALEHAASFSDGPDPLVFDDGPDSTDSPPCPGFSNHHRFCAAANFESL